MLSLHRLVPNDEFRYKAMQEREDTRTDADAVEWTALQKVLLCQCVT